MVKIEEVKQKRKEELEEKEKKKKKKKKRRKRRRGERGRCLERSQRKGINTGNPDERGGAKSARHVQASSRATKGGETTKDCTMVTWEEGAMVFSREVDQKGSHDVDELDETRLCRRHMAGLGSR